MSVNGYQLAVDWDGDGGLTDLAQWERWTPGGTVNPSVVISTIRSHSGTDSLLITWGADGVLPLAQIVHNGLTIGVSYTIRGWVYVPTGSIAVVWAIAGIGFGPASTANDAWNEIAVTFTATATSHGLQIWPAGSPAGGEQVWLDDPIIGPDSGVEDVTSYLLNDPSLQVGYGRDQARTLSPMASGKLAFALNNADRRFSPENSSSPIADDILPGRPVVLRHTDTTSTVTLFDGIIDDYDVDTDAPARDFIAHCLDAWGRPGAENLSTALYQGLRTGEAVNIILDMIGWTGERDIDPGATIMPWWWVENSDATSAIQGLVDSEGPPAVAYVEGGTFIYRDRHHRLLRAASQNVQATFAWSKGIAVLPGDAMRIGRNPGYDRGLRNIINSVTFTVAERRAQTPAVVWTSDDNFELSGGETQIVEAQTTDPFFAAITPVSGTDFTLITGALTVTLSRTSGQSVTIFLQATGTTRFSGLQLRATPVTVSRNQKIMAEDSTSIAKHGRRNYGKDAGFANRYDAKAIAEHVVAVYTQPRPSVTVTVANLDSNYMNHIRNRRISDRVRIVNDDIGLDGEFYIERIDHDIRHLRIHRATFSCEAVEPTQPSNVFRFDVAGAGFDDGVFGYSGIDDPDAVWVWDDATTSVFDVGQFAS